jgi:transcriptional regulator of acetoin/glycerol metabolism
MALSSATAVPGARPELWRIDPAEVLSVDLAGYSHTAQTEAPAHLYELALDEPERTLRAETLSALEVRRPDVRPLLSWFESRGAFSATVIVDEDGPLGFLLLPKGARKATMTLEEARAMRALCDRLSALIAVSSALARSRERELAAVARADTADREVERLARIIGLEAGRNTALAEREARRVRRAAYSPAARMTLDALVRLAKSNAPAVLIAPPGTDAAGWAAILHVESPRQGGPFIVVDGSWGAEHDLERWQDDASSPLCLADGGTLVVLEAAALPAPVQEHLGRALARPSALPRPGVVPLGLVATAREPLSALVEAGRLDKTLASVLTSAPVTLPRLCERAEDLRALTLDALARAGLARSGKPLGLDLSALRVLAEHVWPGNERELEDVIARAAERVTGSVLTAADLHAIGFSPIADLDPTLTPAPVAPRLRPRPRPAPRRR